MGFLLGVGVTIIASVATLIGLANKVGNEGSITEHDRARGNDDLV